MKDILRKYDTFIFDLDGTVYRESRLIDGALKLFNVLNQLNKNYLFISNRTTSTPLEYKIKLKSFGIECEVDQVITSAEVTKDFLIRNHPSKRVFVIGEEVFINYLKTGGVKIVNNKIDIVLVSLDRTLNFRKIWIAQKALKNNAEFYSANIDMTCPIEENEILDAGYTILALEKLTGRKLEKNFGKPSHYIFEKVFSKIHTEKEKCLLIGDRLETDILMANQNQIDSALVLSGVTKSFNNNSLIKPTYVLNQISDIINL